MKSIQYNNTGHLLCLVENLDDFDKIQTDNKTVSLGIETTGFDYTKDIIVGVSIAVLDNDKITSYYIPLRHKKGNNIDIERTFSLIQKIINNNKVFFYNRDFTYYFLEKENIKCGLNHSHDVQILLYLCSNKAYPARNEFIHLYFPDIVIYELDFSQNDFSYYNPEVAFLFAAQKTVLNIMLAQKVWNNYSTIWNIYSLDNESNEVVRWFSKNTKLLISKQSIRNELDFVRSEIDEIKYNLNGILGYEYDLNDINKRIELVKNTIGDIDSLSDYAVKNSTNPIVTLVKKFGELVVYRTTLEKMLEYDDEIRVHYSTIAASTGRLSSGGIKDNSYFNDFNIQNVEKKEIIRYVHKTDDGIGFIVNDDSEGAIKKVKCKGGLRDAFVCPEGYTWVSADYNGEEMVLAACFSKEENLIKPIQEGKDIHKYVAETMFGQSDDESRSKIKQLNFSVIYGATEYSIAKCLKITVEECRDLLNKYFSKLSSLASWQKRMISKARKYGYVKTLFGRPRMLYSYYQSSDYKAADRYACNSPIQGCTPLSGHLETDHSAVRMSTIVGHKIKDVHGSMIIPSHRGEAEPLFCVFRSGDYIICDNNHSLIYGNKKAPKVAFIRDILNKRHRVWLAKLRKKSWRFNRFFFKAPSECASLFKMICKRDDIIKDDNITLNSALFKLALSAHWFKADYDSAVSLRSVASIFGYNVVYNSREDKFRVTFFRKRKTKMKYLAWCFKNEKKVPIGSCTKITDMQMYDNQGFVNKNTGADIIRIDLCKFKKLFDTDNEWATNVRFACTVHDECNFYVKNEYLYKAVEKIYNTMYFKHELMVLPLKASISIGKDWGHLVEVDLKQVKNNNVVEF